MTVVHVAHYIIWTHVSAVHTLGT